MRREELTEKILDIKREKGWTWKQITDEIGGMSPVLVVGALLGQMKLVKPLARRRRACSACRPPRSACSTRCPTAARPCRRPTR
jgi:cyanate lyase